MLNSIETILAQLATHQAVPLGEISPTLDLAGTPLPSTQLCATLQQAGLPVTVEHSLLRLAPDAGIDWLDLPCQQQRRERVNDAWLTIEISKYYWLESTQVLAKRQSPPPPGELRVVVSEYQSRGRGRLGRQWLQSMAEGLALSLTFTFATPVELPPLGLVVGVLLAEKLNALLGTNLKLKWPNDLLLNDKKCGGILIESSRQGVLDTVIIGIGINTHLSATTAQHIASLGGGRAAAAVAMGQYSRTQVFNVLLKALAAGLTEYHSFTPYRPRFTALDGLYGHAVQWQVRGTLVSGVARGVYSDGSLAVHTPDGEHRMVAGDIDRYAV